MWSIIFKNHFFVFVFWNTAEIFITVVRKFFKYKYWNFLTMSYAVTC